MKPWLLPGVFHEDRVTLLTRFSVGFRFLEADLMASVTNFAYGRQDGRGIPEWLGCQGAVCAIRVVREPPIHVVLFYRQDVRYNVALYLHGFKSSDDNALPDDAAWRYARSRMDGRGL